MNNIQVSFAEILPVMQEKLAAGGEVSFTVSGTSMQPMVFDRKDTVTLKKATLPLKKYEVPFYRRDDGQFVLHRIVKIQKNGNYTCRGDNQTVNEPDVRNDQIIGVLSSFERGGKFVDVKKSFKYKIYCRLWMLMYYYRCGRYYFKRALQILFKR